MDPNIELQGAVSEKILEQRKRKMAELHHMSHDHPLVFNEVTSSPSDTTYDCAACAEKVFGSSYSCGECRFYLHKRCAEAPSEIHHPAHADHPLLPDSKHRETEVRCWICREEVKGFIYECSCCEFYLDFNCALLPRDAAGNLIQTLHVSHPHPLISINPTESLFCDGCWGKLTDASYTCFDCRVFFHKKCLELPTEINHPCHRKHHLLFFFASYPDLPSCNMCQYSGARFYYQCAPCNVNIHVACASPQPIIEDKSHHQHPFTLLLRPNNPFHCSACGDQGNHVSYTCSPCNLQVHKDCVSLPRHIRLTLHPHPISHNFSIRTDHDDSTTWDCRICYKKVNIEYGSYYCSQPDCDFVIHVQCSINNSLFYHVVEVENPDEIEEPDCLYEPKSCIIRIIKEIKVGDGVIAGEIEHIGHEHNLIFSEEIKDNKYCNGCVLPILSSFYYCPQCDFFLHKACAELSRKRHTWFNADLSIHITNGIFKCGICFYKCNGFSYKSDDGDVMYICVRCALVPHGFTYQAGEPHFIFFDPNHDGECNACGEDIRFEAIYKCKDCTFSLHSRCLTLPATASHKCDVHSLTFVYQDPDDYPLRHYCDICEEEIDRQQWLYHCETCDNAMHIKCVLGKYAFIKAGSKYTYEDHPHTLTFVKKTYYYPECVLCGKPCQDLALECQEYACKYIVHWSCIKPSDDDSD